MANEAKQILIVEDDFSPEGGHVVVGLYRDDCLAEIWVQDSGAGIPDDDLPHVFDRFHRGRNAAAYPGSGLGLAITNAIIERHGGTIAAKNAASGTRFSITLPVSN